MGPYEFAGDRQAEPAAAGTGRAVKRAEQIFPGLGRQSGAIIGDVDHECSAIARGGKAQPASPRLYRVARQVHENPVQLIAVGLDSEVWRDRVFYNEILLGDGEAWTYFVDQRC